MHIADSARPLLYHMQPHESMFLFALALSEHCLEHANFAIAMVPARACRAPEQHVGDCHSTADHVKRHALMGESPALADQHSDQEE